MQIDKNKKIKILLLLFFVMAAIIVCELIFVKPHIPEKIGRPLTQEEKATIIKENSSMIDYIQLSPHGDFPRKDKIKKITIHHMAGNYTLEEVGRNFAFEDRDASANYGIDSNGRVGIFVEEANRSWASSNEENDQQAVTIEVANDEIDGDWHVSDKAFNALIELCTDICKRNDIKRINFTGDIDGNLTYHKMFNEHTKCPGPYLEGRMVEIAERINENLEKEK